MENIKIRVSNGNSKMGRIPSVSLPPVKTCAEGCTCAKKCYAAKFCRIYPNVKNAYDLNLTVYENNPSEYFRQVADVLKMSRFFRLHVSGDFPNYEYFREIVRLIKDNPGCEVLVFTKRYSMVNDFLSWHVGKGDALPENLHLIFSEWDEMPMYNPYNLPVAHVVFKGCEPSENWIECTGNCETCAKSGSGCWGLKNGEHVYFNEH